MGKQIGALGVACAIAAGVCCAVLLIGGHGQHASLLSLLWPILTTFSLRKRFQAQRWSSPFARRRSSRGKVIQELTSASAFTGCITQSLSDLPSHCFLCTCALSLPLLLALLLSHFCPLSPYLSLFLSMKDVLPCCISYMYICVYGCKHMFVYVCVCVYVYI